MALDATCNVLHRISQGPAVNTVGLEYELHGGRGSQRAEVAWEEELRYTCREDFTLRTIARLVRASFVVTAFMRSEPPSGRLEPMNRVTTSP